MTDSIAFAFSAEHIVKLTGLSVGQLRYWDRIGFFKPFYATEGVNSPYSRVYSFKDAVGLRTISVLKGKHGVSLPHLREVAKKLLAYSKTPWSDIQLKVWNRKVQFEDPETGKTRGVVDGQYVLLPIIQVIEEVKASIVQLKSRKDDQLGKIEQHRYIAHNAKVIAGTRIPVKTILKYLIAGYEPLAIIKEYPSLTEEDIASAAKMGESTLAA